MGTVQGRSKGVMDGGTAKNNNVSQNQIKISGVSKYYGKKKALSDIDLTIQRGCLVFLAETVRERQR